MIDWISACIPVPRHWLTEETMGRGGCTVFTKPGGEIERIVPRWLDVQGSFDSGMRVRMGTKGIYLSGNPIKWLSGQNLDGPDSAASLLSRVVGPLMAALGWRAVLSITDARISRVDVTRSLHLGRTERVREVLRVAAITARARHQGAATASHQTIYFGQHSRRHTVKLYCKADETRSHVSRNLPTFLYEELTAQAEGLLRIEVTIRGPQLKEDHNDLARAWITSDVADQYWSRYWGTVTLSSGVDLMDDQTIDLPRRLRRTYDLWRRGGDCSELLSRSTFWRHRKELLEASAGSIDLSVLRPSTETTPVGIHDIGAWLRAAPEWHAKGRLSEWIEQTASAA